MELSIIIINWKSTDYLRKCLLSIKPGTLGLQFEIIVVDNASYDGCEEMLASEYPTVKFIQSPANLGFSGGNNLGASFATGKALLFLNPDTEICGNALKGLYGCLTSSPEFGAIGCKLLNTDFSLQTSCILPFPTIVNQVLDVEWLKLNLSFMNLWGMRPLLNEKPEPAEVEAISGACIMIKNEVFTKTGGFSKDYFMYSEDVDICRKIRGAGWKVVYLSTESVIHHGGASSSKSVQNYFNSIVMRESIEMFLRKYRSEQYAKAYRSIMTIVSLIRMAVLAIAFPVLGMNKFKKWYKIFRWSVGLEPWAAELHTGAN